MAGSIVPLIDCLLQALMVALSDWASPSHAGPRQGFSTRGLRFTHPASSTALSTKMPCLISAPAEPIARIVTGKAPSTYPSKPVQHSLHPELPVSNMPFPRGNDVARYQYIIHLSVLLCLLLHRPHSRPHPPASCLRSEASPPLPFFFTYSLSCLWQTPPSLIALCQSYAHFSRHCGVVHIHKGQ